jgi:leucyl aminopeptidase
MPIAMTSTSISCVNEPLSAATADLLVVPWFDDPSSAVPGLDAATGGEIARALASGEFQGKPFEILVTPFTDRQWRARRVALIGAGRSDECGGELIRKLAAAAGLTARQKRVGSVAFVVRGRGDVAELAQAASEGLTLSEFYSGAYKTSLTGDQPPAPPPAWTVVVEGGGDVVERAGRAVARGRILGESCNLARELANEPGNTLTPASSRNGDHRKGTRVSSRTLAERQIEAGMGLLLGVARGSNEPPRDRVPHDPPGAPDAPVLSAGHHLRYQRHLAQTGGKMEQMKDDMAGGAAVACAMRAIALLKAPVRVIGVVPTTENMPGGRAIKPGDILKSAAGKTVEVINTDAEGRLILGDGLWYARQLGATHLVDVATLTGAVVVALGKSTSGLFGTPPEWVDRVRKVADRAGDRVWPMPMFDDYKEQLKSEIADFTNTGGRPAGSITAAMFLKEFAGDLPWAHLDIAGTAWMEEAKPFQPKGASGVAVRTLAELAFAMKGES